MSHLREYIVTPRSDARPAYSIYATKVKWDSGVVMLIDETSSDKRIVAIFNADVIASIIEQPQPLARIV